MGPAEFDGDCVGYGGSGDIIAEKDSIARCSVSLTCSMCGDVGLQSKLFKCVNLRCHRYQHSYCSQYYSPLLQEDMNSGFLCDWCTRIGSSSNSMHNVRSHDQLQYPYQRSESDDSIKLKKHTQAFEYLLQAATYIAGEHNGNDDDNKSFTEVQHPLSSYKQQLGHYKTKHSKDDLLHNDHNDEEEESEITIAKYPGFKRGNSNGDSIMHNKIMKRQRSMSSIEDLNTMKRQRCMSSIDDLNAKQRLISRTNSLVFRIRKSTNCDISPSGIKFQPQPRISKGTIITTFNAHNCSKFDCSHESNIKDDSKSNDNCEGFKGFNSYNVSKGSTYNTPSHHYQQHQHNTIQPCHNSKSRDMTSYSRHLSNTLPIIHSPSSSSSHPWTPTSPTTSFNRTSSKRDHFPLSNPTRALSSPRAIHRRYKLLADVLC